ncbi:MAG: DUF739 family protein [Lachnospiraceae bacterium]|nr:DUF739 family protein [Lachnospiraceae bacterium]
MPYDYSKLRGRIREKYKTEGAFAKAMNLSKASLSCKLNNSVGFSQSEMQKIIELLHVKTDELKDFFFRQ